MIGAITALGAGAIALAVFLSRSPAAPGPTGLARWDAAAARAFTPWAERVAVMSRYLQEWQGGGLATPVFVTEVSRTARLLDRTEVAANGLPPYPGEPAVDAMYRDAAGLYVASNQVLAAAADLEPGGLRDQVVELSERVRELGDRTFDQGRSLTASGLAPAGVPAGSVVELPAEVPDWVAEGLQAGPPLAPPPAPAAPFPPVRQGSRPTEPGATWVRAVVGLGARRPVDLSADGSTLGAQAAALEEEASAIAAMPDPAVTHGREASDRLRLSLLSQAEACRAAQAATLAPVPAAGSPGPARPVPSQLRGEATALLAIARDLPVPSLP